MRSRRRLSWPGLLFAAAALGAAVAAEAAVESRIVTRIDASERTTLGGNVHPAALAEFDRGPVAADYPMRRVRLLLKRSAAQEAALEQAMAQQSDPASPEFHRWLTPAQFGALYGPSDADIEALSRWLAAEGFTVDAVNAGRTMIEFSGSAAGIAQAFHTEIHEYLVDGVRHVANRSEPSIPTALAPLVAGIGSLGDFFARPLHHDLGTMRRGTDGGWRPAAGASSDAAGDAFSPSGTGGFQLVSPDDFAVIYDVQALWNAGIDGSGETIAIAGRSAIQPADVASFRAAFGLPANPPRIIVNGANPGVPDANEKIENTLDVEWAGAVAKGAAIVLVTTASTNTSDGAVASALYIIENRIAPVMSFSYGVCEASLGAAGNALYKALWQQAAAEGIAVFVASGDQGSAGCDQSAPPLYGAEHGLAVNGTASTPYDTAVGGTDLDWINLPATAYWAAGAITRGATALQYIPEVPWNSSCAGAAYDRASGATARGLDAEEICNAALARGSTGSLDFNGGGGGASRFYAKPAWQSGTGVPADGRRDLPDVSLFAANGMLRTAYVICDSTSGPCSYGASGALAQAVGGTSVAAPAMAGIMALVNQKMGAPQGNANAGLYALAARDTRANCNSMTMTAGNACNFHDIATDGNAVPCAAHTPDCVVLHPGDKLGILAGYKATVGFDSATGLGSANAAHLVDNWHLTAAPAAVKVPNVVGSVQTAAAALLKSAGVAAGTVSPQRSATVPVGRVISENPPAGSRVAAGSKVNLVVSRGPR